MIKLGDTDPILQRIADEMSADSTPPALGSLSPAELRADLEARGIEPTTNPDHERRRGQAKRRQARRWEKKRR